METNQLVHQVRETFVMVSRQVISVVEAPNATLVKQAEEAIANFASSIAPSVWPFLDKQTVLSEIRARVRNPYLVGQGGQPFCGPASVLFELVRRNPQRYVEICHTLFVTGGIQSHTQFISASEPLRQASRGELRMGQADWMILATLREKESSLFPIEPNSPDLVRNLAGMTKSWELKGWVKEILGFSQVSHDYTFLINDIPAIQKAAQALQQGGAAFALITAEGMLSDTPPLIPYPSHWVTLVGNISVQPASVSLDIYTWSKKMRLDMSQGAFKKYLWAIVTGKP
jgi:hypothetical protein